MCCKLFCPQHTIPVELLILLVQPLFVLLVGVVQGLYQQELGLHSEDVAAHLLPRCPALEPKNWD